MYCYLEAKNKGAIFTVFCTKKNSDKWQISSRKRQFSSEKWQRKVVGKLLKSFFHAFTASQN